MMVGRGRGWYGHGGHGRGVGRPGGWQQADLPPADDAAGWFAGRLPDGWFTGTPEVTVDRDEILVVGTLEAPTVEGGDAAAVGAAEAGRISRFREDTREERIAIAREAEHRYGRKVAWGAVAGGTRQLFTTLSAPVMTRLRQPERQVLDTLVDAGVARSRSEALAWCVRLVGEHADSWLTDLRQAMGAVDRLRAQGPDVSGADEDATES
jgi:hypothetical protein